MQRWTFPLTMQSLAQRILRDSELKSGKNFLFYFVRFHPIEFHDDFIFDVLMNNTITEKTVEIEEKIHLG